MANSIGDPLDASGSAPENVTATITIEPETPRTASDMLAEALIGEKIGARRLTFSEQCGAFAALYGGMRNQVVARAFGVSLQCVSKISGCLEYDPDPYRFEVDPKTDLVQDEKILMDHNRNRSPSRRRHYEDVAREFEAKGKDRFTALYYTPRVHERLMLAKMQIRDEKKSGK